MSYNVDITGVAITSSKLEIKKCDKLKSVGQWIFDSGYLVKLSRISYTLE